jgi:hypothetical protein
MAPDEQTSDAASRAGNLRAATQAAKNGISPESQGDLRADIMARNRLQKLKEKANKAAAAVLSPAKKAISGLLKAAWENLIDTFGLTLFWIDIHVFGNKVFGKNLFCDLGEEWLPEKPGFIGGDDKAADGVAKKAVEGVTKTVGLVETMGCCCLNLGCLFLILGVLSIIALISNYFANPFAALGQILKDIWDSWKK